MTTGFHSQNFTFHVHDYTRGSLLHYLHLCQRGKVEEGENEEEILYQGTSKSCEGYAASVVFQKMHDEGMNIDTHWQDADSTSARAVRKHFKSVNVMLCGGHYSRAHYNQLKKIKQQKQFGPGEKSLYKAKFPAVEHVKCKCNKQHSKNCGCINDAFISHARKNLFSALIEAGKDPSILKAKLEMLPHHARNEHVWDGGKCDFHPLKVCICGKCPKNGDLECEGKDYKTENMLNCPYHELAYEIQCHHRAQQAEDVIHRELGRGHTNQLESANSALIRYRRKSWNIQRTHYHVSTNFGLLESNLTFMHSVKGIAYHWVPELLQELGLPNIDVVRAYLKKRNREREERRLMRQSTEYRKKAAKAKHQHRVTEQQERQKYTHKVKEMKGHTYFEPEEGEYSKIVSQAKGQGKACKCGSTSHQRTTHKDCPFSKQKSVSVESEQHSEVESDFADLPSENSLLESSEDERIFSEEESVILCDCGRAYKRDCRYNPAI